MVSGSQLSLHFLITFVPLCFQKFFRTKNVNWIKTSFRAFQSSGRCWTTRETWGFNGVSASFLNSPHQVRGKNKTPRTIRIISEKKDHLNTRKEKNTWPHTKGYSFHTADIWPYKCFTPLNLFFLGWQIGENLFAILGNHWFRSKISCL